MPETIPSRVQSSFTIHSHSDVTLKFSEMPDKERCLALPPFIFGTKPICKANLPARR